MLEIAPQKRTAHLSAAQTIMAGFICMIFIGALLLNCTFYRHLCKLRYRAGSRQYDGPLDTLWKSGHIDPDPNRSIGLYDAYNRGHDSGTPEHFSTKPADDTNIFQSG